MSDCIVSQITQNIKSTLKTVSSYGGTPKCVELDRFVLNVNNRYPFILISGPLVECEIDKTRSCDSMINYEIKYFINESDDSDVANTEITHITRNVASDIFNKLKEDETRGGLAQKTEFDNAGYDFEYSEDDLMDFFVFIDITVLAKLDSNDPYYIA